MSVPSTFRRYRRALGRELRGIRETCGRTGNQLSKDLGWSQSKVSRLETGAQFCTEEDVHSWCVELGVPRAEELRLLTLLHQAEAEYLNWKESYRLAGSAVKKQEEILRYEKLSTQIFEFQPSVVPGLIQTQAYASELLALPTGPSLFGASNSDISKMVSVRMRRQEILYDTSKKVRIVVLESALMTRVVSEPVLIEQLLRLKDLNQFTMAQLRVIPIQSRVPAVPLNGFVTYDDDLVVVETLSGEQHLSERSEVSAYISVANALEESALGLKDSRLLVQHIINRVSNSKGDGKCVVP